MRAIRLAAHLSRAEPRLASVPEPEARTLSRADGLGELRRVVWVGHWSEGDHTYGRLPIREDHPPFGRVRPSELLRE